jgi:hypothetical protein
MLRYMMTITGGGKLNLHAKTTLFRLALQFCEITPQLQFYWFM